MIFDSDVLIAYLRGSDSAMLELRGTPERALSVVSYMELIQGARDKRSLGIIRSFLGDLGFRTLPLTESIGGRAAVYMEAYALKGGLGMADALIAATAVETRETLCTGNGKHYKLIPGLALKTFRHR